jgi:hypothetical protein
MFIQCRQIHRSHRGRLKEDSTAGGPIGPVDALQDATFTSAAGSPEHQRFTTMDSKAHIIDALDAFGSEQVKSECFRKVFHLKHIFHPTFNVCDGLFIADSVQPEFM